MGKHRHFCLNGTLDDSKYASPMPYIGLYVTGATSVCFLLIFIDIVAGFCHRKIWFPCRFFSLNSAILMLLSVATKIPVDLTSPMPRVQDQLSKLTGTAFLCVSIGFLIPSAGVQTATDLATNIAAVSILLYTVYENLLIQINSGVIFVFLLEHQIIMSCTVLMVSLWSSAVYYIRYKKVVSAILTIQLWTSPEGSLAEKLIKCYYHCYESNPQFILSKNWRSPLSGLLCILCVVAVISAVFRSLILNHLHFCKGASDYGWTMGFIVTTQILIIVVGGIAAGFRWWGLVFSHISILAKKSSKSSCTVFRKEYRKLFSEGVFKELSLHKAKEEINILQEECLTKNRPSHLNILIRRTRPSQQPLNDQLQSRAGDEHCLLWLMILLKITVVSIPVTLCEILVQTFSETSEIIDFIDKRVSSRKRTETSDRAARKWRQIFLTHKTDLECNLSHALGIIGEFEGELDSKYDCDEVGTIVNFITSGVLYDSLEELYNRIEQLFVDILQGILKELPNAISKEVHECPVEEYEDRFKRALKFLFKVESLDFAGVKWVFPVGSNIKSLISDEGTHGDTPVETDVNPATRSSMSPTQASVAIHVDADDEIVEVGHN